jgi:putative DNA primase/helicase
MSIFRTDFESLLDPSERGNLVQYQPAIQEAQELRVLEPEKDSNEAMIAAGLEEAFPPLISIGKEWYRYSDGCWRKFTIEEYHPQIMELMPGKYKTARHVSSIVDHLQMKSQMPPGSVNGAYSIAHDGAIYLNVENGILTVGSGDDLELIPHDQGQHFSMSLSASYYPAANAPLFMDVLDQCLPDKEDQRLLQLFCGNILLPDARFETALVCIGGAGTGKSTLAEAVGGALGQGVVMQSSLQQICSANGYHLPGLRHSLVNLGTELNATEMADSSVFKSLVSGEAIEAREIYGKPGVMRATCKLWFLANNLPRFKHGTGAEVRRLRFLNFNRKPSKPDNSLKHRLEDEGNGIFNWMVQGLVELLQASQIPEGGSESISIKERFKLNNDHVSAFIEECCEVGDDYKTSKESLYGAYVEFCESRSTNCLEDNIFWRLLRERLPEIRDYRPRHGDGNRPRLCKGIELKPALCLGSY